MSSQTCCRTYFQSECFFQQRVPFKKCVSRVFLKMCFQKAFRSKTCSRLFFVRGVGGSGRRPVSPPAPRGARRVGKRTRPCARELVSDRGSPRVEKSEIGGGGWYAKGVQMALLGKVSAAVGTVFRPKWFFQRFLNEN